MTLLLAIPGKPQAPPDSDPAPLVTISLPTSVTSETVQIRYFLIGPFGGRSDYVKSGVGLRSYQIRAYPEEKAAQSVKIVIYAPACEFQTLDLAFSGNKDLQEDSVCRPLRSIKLAGQFPQELVENENTELLVTYTAYWVNRFFGIMDGFVPRFTVARTQPNTDGSFVVDIPDFTSDPSASSSDDEETVGLSLRDSQTLNPIGHGLEPELAEFRSRFHLLRIVSVYPERMHFIPVSPRRCVVFSSPPATSPAATPR